MHQAVLLCFSVCATAFALVISGWGSSAGHKAPQIKEKTERNRDCLLQVTFCREKKRAGGEENQTLKAKTHNPTFSYSESRTIHAWIRMRRAYIVYRTMPVISTQRYRRIEFCKI